MKTTTAWFLGLAVTAFLAQGARSDVTDMRENSFSIESKVTTRAAAAVVYRELGRLSRWWDSEHTYSGSAKNLSLQMQAGGCFCETTSNGGSIQHGRVIYAQPNEWLRLDAPLGPLQDMPVTGVLTFKLAPAESGGTQVTMTYRVAGGLTMETGKLAPLVDQVMRIQLDRLKAHTDSLAK